MAEHMTTVGLAAPANMRIPAANLAAWTSKDWTHGTQIDELSDFADIVVETRNSSYEITIIAGRSGEVLIRGGKFFPEKTPAEVLGASLGGSFLKRRGIYSGLKLEILHDGRRIVTSPVCSITVQTVI